MGLDNISGDNLGPLIINEAYDAVSDSTKAIASGQKVHSQTALSIIAGQLRADMAVNRQGVRNANDAISMVQTFDAAAGSINSNLRQMSRLAMQAGTGTFSDVQNEAIEAEFGALDPQTENDFAENHLISDRFGFGDLRLYFDYPIFSDSGDLETRLGLFSTVPMAASIIKGLKGKVFSEEVYEDLQVWAYDKSIAYLYSVT